MNNYLALANLLIAGLHVSNQSYGMAAASFGFGLWLLAQDLRQ